MRPIKENEGLDPPGFLERNPPKYPSIQVLYRCPKCRSKLEIPLPDTPPSCPRCNQAMRLKT